MALTQQMQQQDVVDSLVAGQLHASRDFNAKQQHFMTVKKQELLQKQQFKDTQLKKQKNEDAHFFNMRNDKSSSQSVKTDKTSNSKRETTGAIYFAEPQSLNNLAKAHDAKVKNIFTANNAFAKNDGIKEQQERILANDIQAFDLALTGKEKKMRKALEKAVHKLDKNVKQPELTPEQNKYLVKKEAQLLTRMATAAVLNPDLDINVVAGKYVELRQNMRMEFVRSINHLTMEQPNAPTKSPIVKALETQMKLDRIAELETNGPGLSQLYDDSVSAGPSVKAK